jgi:single-stranded DNA-binding protein
MSNQVKLVGRIASLFTFSHTLYGEDFYNVTLCVRRDSGNADMIPLIVSDRLIDVSKNLVACYMYVAGEFRSYNQHDTDKSRLKLYVFVNSIEAAEPTNINDVFLEGYICKQPIYRHTPLGREIADVMLAVNRGYNKSDYIPCILWGRNAYYIKSLTTGDRIRVAGRIQSRKYLKNGESKEAYELSVNLLEVC